MRRRLTETVLATAALMLVVWLLSPLGILQSRRAGAEKIDVPAGHEVATFAGGCFWCMEPPYEVIDGVKSVTSGFMGGKTDRPTYMQVVNGGTGHAEVVHIVYDPAKVTYKQLLAIFWRNVDPYDKGGQFCDRGDAYRTAIFFHTPSQKAEADAAKAELAKAGPSKDPIATEVLPAGAFTAAEDYHQDYYKKNPYRYKIYRYNCGRDRRLEALWGKATN